jgi:CHASE2 domain-containing sensor protein
VAFDILFLDRRDEDLRVELTSGERIDSDEFFAREMGRAGNVLLGAEGSTRQERVWPAELFRTNAWDLGAISFAFDQDGVMRRMPAFVDAGNRRVWNLGLLLAAKGLGLDLENATVEARQIICRGSNGLLRTIPIHGQQILPAWDLSWPEIKKQSDTSLANLLALDYGRQKLGGGLSQGFHNKLVMLGAASVDPASEGMIVDSIETPIGQIPGMAAYLNVANSLLADRFVRPYTQASLLTTITLCTGLALGLLRRGPDWTSSTRVIALLAVIWIAAYALMGEANYWMPLVAPTLAVVIALTLLKFYCSVFLGKR